MAPTYATADINFGNAAYRLQASCTLLERYLPPIPDTEVEQIIEVPPLRPRRRADSVAACVQCEGELRDMSPGARDGHQCTHRREPSPVGSDDERRQRTVRTRGRQQDAGVIRQELKHMTDRFDAFTVALATLCSLMTNVNEIALYERHLMRWTDYYGWMRDRAEETILMLEPRTFVPLSAFGSVGTTSTSVQSTATTTQSAIDQPGTSAMGVTQVLELQQSKDDTEQREDETTEGDHLLNNVTEGAGAGENFFASTNFDLAKRSVDLLCTTIENDLFTLEQEISSEDVPHTDTGIADLKEYCDRIESKVNLEFKEASEKLARLDTQRRTNAALSLIEKSTGFLNRLRVARTELRKLRGSASASVSSASGTVAPRDPPQTYKPYVEKLKPPTFSGKIEDWPEFRSVWTELFSELPENVQLQHLKANIPVDDKRRVTGAKSLKDAWERLEDIYGNKDLNVLTVKSNLESLVPKAVQDHKRIMEIFEAVETAKGQLENLDSLHYLKDDLGLMNKLVLKLPQADQRQYSQYITSAAIESDPSSRWDKFYLWLKRLHKSAVQSGLMQMCDKTGQSKSSGDTVVRSGITCRTCGGIGHFARACSSKQKSSGSPVVKVNIAVSKITTKDDYNKHLADTRKQVGNCPACSQAPHSYTRTFPFGKAEWPSNRLDSCPRFISMSPKERGELVERLKACYKCTCWKHQGAACFNRSRSNCSVTSNGNACGGVHNKLLHGSGVAFCHKVEVKVANVSSQDYSGDQVLTPPDISCPVLLEIQSISVHNNTAKVMFDNGSTAALMTHSFAKRAGLKGVNVAYWLAVVGYDRVLRHTMLYSFYMEDNFGIKHEVQAYGIDQISEDTVIMDLEGVKSVFPGAPLEVFDRPHGPIDILIGSMYKNIQPYGGEDGFSRGRLRLVKSLFGCGYVLTGTHPSIRECENSLTAYAKTLVNCATIDRDYTVDSERLPTMLCNRSVAMLKIPEYFEAEDLGVAPARSCKRCRGCKECSYRNAMVTREKEIVVKRVEDQMLYDSESCRVKVSYPWTEDVFKLTDNLHQAIRVQSSVERRLLKDSSMLDAYNSEFRKFVDRGAISKLTEEDAETYSGPISYVTHLPVFKPDSTTTPLRIVTNTSFVNERAKLSPNDCMNEGPNALSSLLEVLISFRMNEVALVYDLTKAYQSIYTGDIEKNVRRIVWRWGKTDEPWEIYGYEVVTFGDQVAGLVLELVKGLAAELGQSIDTEACQQIKNKTYVDDGAGGGSRQQVDRFRGKMVNGKYTGTISQILQLVGLNLKVMVASGDSDREALEILGEKVLGHVWKATADKFVFRITVNLTPAKFKKRAQTISKDLVEDDIPRLPGMTLTKRVLLGFVNSQYDPMGLISPLLIILKINLQEMFGSDVNLGWDDPISGELFDKWVAILSMVLRIGDITIDRAVRPPGVEDVPDIIGFADGSLMAYACAVYVRWIKTKILPSDPDRYVVRLICAKARVTSLKGTTAPRSELSGFLILSRLLKVVINSMDVKPREITIAVDSQCTVSALEKSGGLLAPYFASRVSESLANIAELADEIMVNPVQHVPGPLNPADIPTRNTTKPDEVMEGSIWQNGPAYLALSKEHWPFSRDFLDLVPDTELRAPRAAFNAAVLIASECLLGNRITSIVETVMERSNCLSKTIHVTARLMKCYFDQSRDRVKDPLTVEDIKTAQLLQFIVSMKPTIEAVNRGELDPLRPVMDRGIVYIRGRCDRSLLNLLGVDRLPVLARQTRLAKLIMIQAHYEDHRSSPTDVLARSRRISWIVRGRFLAKEVCKVCPLCKLHKRKMTQQIMADIPHHQLSPCPPFSFISIDFAGPFQVRAMVNSRSKLKVWGLVVICQNTRAVRMYATAGYSTDEFLTAFTRFTSNHGNPLLVVSDSGSQLVKAGKITEAQHLTALDWTKVGENAAKNGTKWKVVEPGCQWRNGLAEAAVKLVKTTLELTIASQQMLNFTELDTLFSSVANTVNQRPIGVKSFTEDDLVAITPNDLLLGRTRNSVPGVTYDENETLTKRQQLLQELEHTWWNQWIKQVLPHLVPFKKWRTEHRSLQVGDVVLVHYERKIDKGTYRLARVLKVHPDVHGNVRTVTVGLRKRDSREAAMPYVPKPLEEIVLGVQRLAVICPLEEQQEIVVRDGDDRDGQGG